MNTRKLFQLMTRWLLVFTVIFLFSACSDVVDHAFEFDATRDSPDVEILDYQYGNSELPSAHNPDYLKVAGQSLQSTNIIGPMRRADALFVKWRIKSTGQVYEDTVDLRHRLPRNIKDHIVYFMIKDSQLYVYLITPYKRQENEPPNGPKASAYLRTLTIYPDQPKQ